MKPNEFILEYLTGKDYTTPTEIGIAYGEFKHGLYHWKSGYHSAWASPRCKKLVEEGLLERSDLGHYRLRQPTR